MLLLFINHLELSAALLLFCLFIATIKYIFSANAPIQYTIFQFENGSWLPVSTSHPKKYIVINRFKSFHSTLCKARFVQTCCLNNNDIARLEGVRCSNNLLSVYNGSQSSCKNWSAIHVHLPRSLWRKCWIILFLSVFFKAFIHHSHTNRFIHLVVMLYCFALCFSIWRQEEHKKAHVMYLTVHAKQLVPN